jgi:hypothetical protein
LHKGALDLYVYFHVTSFKRTYIITYLRQKLINESDKIASIINLEAMNRHSNITLTEAMIEQDPLLWIDYVKNRSFLKFFRDAFQWGVTFSY